MIILEEPYISEQTLEYLKNSQQPVLENDFVKKYGTDYGLNLISEKDAAERGRKGERFYTISENALDWIYKNLSGCELVRKIDVMKDKAGFRRVTADLYPDLYFYEMDLEELKTFDISIVKLPAVLKPAVGFYSVGVYTIFTPEDYQKALNDIEEHQKQWNKNFSGSVIGSSFILEKYIKGAEFAIDAYYDVQGEPVILNILTHRFASHDDVSDRIYYTSAKIIEEYLMKFTQFLKRINQKLMVRDFPMHVEIRTDGEQIVPIEFNPLRFAGLCTTDIAYYAYGINTIECYMNQLRPDFASIIKEKKGKIYSMILLDKGGEELPSEAFNYNKLYTNFEHVLAVRKVSNPALGLFAFLFTETSNGNESELDQILQSNLLEYRVSTKE
ncbi:ATP-grasp domain-containing protein [Anaerovorax odorimutans]|uniref:ATP-grasp domain-containing protein n=1 Tax=Anaerovorax odorimutans TaxID=109327 RepID=UPI000417A1B9|nr:ATP-grasp domain-containing protein [Anaerovorax odorimutans]